MARYNRVLLGLCRSMELRCTPLGKGQQAMSVKETHFVCFKQEHKEYRQKRAKHGHLFLLVRDIKPRELPPWNLKLYPPFESADVDRDHGGIRCRRPENELLPCPPTSVGGRCPRFESTISNPHTLDLRRARYKAPSFSLTGLPERQTRPPLTSILESGPAPFSGYKAGQRSRWKPGVRFFCSPDTVNIESNLEPAVEEVLKNVESLDDLTDEVVWKLRAIIPEAFPVQKFHVTPLGYQNWLRGREDIRGVEYDSKKSRIIVNTLSGVLHSQACDVFTAWLREVSKEMDQTTGSTYKLVRDKR